MDPPPPGLEHISLEAFRLNGRDLVTLGGEVVLSAIPPGVTVEFVPEGALLGLESDETSASLESSVGSLRVERFLALSRTSLWWMTPSFGEDPADVPLETQLLLGEVGTKGRGGDDAGEAGGRGEGAADTGETPSFTVALAPLLANSSTFKGSLLGERATRARAGVGGTHGSPPPGNLRLRAESGSGDVAAERVPRALLVAASRSPDRVAFAELAVALAAGLSGGGASRRLKAQSPALDVLGWCTWDAAYSSIDQDKVEEGVGTLRAGGVTPGLVILDDGWQRTKQDGGWHKGGEGEGEGKGEGEGAGEGAEASEAAPSGGARAAAQALPGAASRACWGALDGAIRGLMWLGKPRGSPLARLSRRLLSAPPLRRHLEGYWNRNIDHTRRLVDVRPNGKFQSDAEARRRVVAAGNDVAMSTGGGDLSSLTASLKHQGVSYVFAWHAAFGYWGGLAAGTACDAYDPLPLPFAPPPGILAVDPSEAHIPPALGAVRVPRDPRALHAALHAALASQGVDGVKVDVQSTVGALGGRAVAGRGGAERGQPDTSPGGPALTARYQASLEASHAEHFGASNIINCMCHSTENLYHLKTSNWARVSDDFWPLVRASHTAHVAHCAFNSVLIGALCVPDFDMFQSRHTAGWLHAAARSVSGGPVYVSDRPGAHDFDVLRRVAFPDGSVPRCLDAGRPPASSLFDDPLRGDRAALKVVNINALTGVVLAANVQGSAYCREACIYRTHSSDVPELRALVRASDVPALLRGLQAKHDAAGWAGSEGWTGGFVALVDLLQGARVAGERAPLAGGRGGGGGGVDRPAGPARHLLHLASASETVSLELPLAAAAVVTLAPTYRLRNGVSFSALGTPGMLNAGGAVVRAEAAVVPASGRETASPAARVTFRGAGEALLWAEAEPTRAEVDGTRVETRWDPATGALTFDLPGRGIRDEAVVLLAW